MKRLRRVFELTVAEQRVVIVLLLAFVLIVAYQTHRERVRTATPPITQSPSPGTLP